MIVSSSSRSGASCSRVPPTYAAGIITQIEQKAIEITGRNHEADSVRTEVGSLRRGGMSRSSGVHLGEVTVDLIDFAERQRMGTEVRDELREEISEITGVRASNIEEVSVRVEASDDFGLDRLELHYAVNGGDW